MLGFFFPQSKEVMCTCNVTRLICWNLQFRNQNKIIFATYIFVSQNTSYILLLLKIKINKISRRIQIYIFFIVLYFFRFMFLSLLSCVIYYIPIKIRKTFGCTRSRILFFFKEIFRLSFPDWNFKLFNS